MTEEIVDIARKKVVYEMPGMDDVTVRKDHEFGAAGSGSSMDVYYPSRPEDGVLTPVVIIVAGYPDAGVARVFGRSFKEMGSSVSWAKLIAASGLAAITYSNVEPEADLDALLAHLRRNAENLGVDGNTIGLWASSGNVPLALSPLMQGGTECLKCAVLCYGYTLDVPGAHGVAEAAAKFGFANPAAGKSVTDLRRDVPLFLARAGQDQFPHLNEMLDRFVAGALTCNLPVTLVNHPQGPHAFDLLQNTEPSREVIRQILAFLRFHLLQ